jgi:hypothetical protein
MTPPQPSGPLQNTTHLRSYRYYTLYKNVTATTVRALTKKNAKRLPYNNKKLGRKGIILSRKKIKLPNIWVGAEIFPIFPLIKNMRG